MKAAVLTISDRCSKGETQDTSGPAVREMLKNHGFEVVSVEIVPDDIDVIEARLVKYADEAQLDVVITTGGTGLGPRDVTPEATLRVIDRTLPGISEMIRKEGTKFTKRAALSRGVAGLSGNTLIVNLPGSEKGARDSLSAVIDILPHAVDMIAGKRHEI